MTTYTETIKAYQGLPTGVRVRVFNKYDYSTIITSDITINETDLKDYDGFSGVTAPVFDDAKATVDLSDTILPWKWDYENKLTTSKFAIANYGTSVTQDKYVYNETSETWQKDGTTETLTGCVKGWVNNDPNSALNNEFQVYAIGDERVELYSEILSTSPSVLHRPIFTTPYGTFRYLGNVTVDIQSLPVKYYAWSYTTAGDVTTTVYTLSSTPSANDYVYTYNSTYNSMTQTETTITSVGDGSITVGSGFYAITYNRALLKDKTLYNF